MNLGGLADLGSYRFSDFLMFSPTLYWRLFEDLNARWWPAPQMLMAALATALWLEWRAPAAARERDTVPTAARVSPLLLATANAAAAFLFLHQAFAPIMPTADWAAVAFGWQTAALLGWAVWTGGRDVALATGRRRSAGLALLTWASVVHPALPAITGRPWQQAECLGLAPDPTAMATLGLLLLWQGRSAAARWVLRLLWLVPTLWCGLSGLLLLTMGSGQGVLVWAAALLAVASARAGTAPQRPSR